MFAPSPLPPGQDYTEDSDKQTPFIAPGASTFQKDIPSASSVSHAPSAAASFSNELPFQYSGHPGADLDGADTDRPQGMSPDPYAEYFSAYGTSGHAAYPGSYGAEPGFSEEGKGVSPLHIALIAMILLAGLALGVGRQWWIEEKLEAVTAKKTSVAGLSSREAIDEPIPSSIQSSLDRAYIPPLLAPEKETQSEEKSAKLSVAPDPVTNAPSASEVPSPPIKSDPVSEHEQADSVKARNDADTAKQAAAAPRTEPPAAPSEKKRKSARGDAARKMASASKKERSKEIDRVRTQAFSETSKDRIGERKSGPSESPVGPQSERRGNRRTSKLAQSTVTSAQYGRCERISHIIRREQCKWALCNNKWGKGACPSFRNEKPSLF